MRAPFFFAALGAVGAGIAIALLAPAHPASAHPLGNFTVNQLESLSLYPDRVEVAAVVDNAEIPTRQQQSIVDANGDGVTDAAELSTFAAARCTALAGGFHVAVGGHRLMWTVSGPAFGYTPGVGGLPTSRLSCTLTAAAALGGPASVSIENVYQADRIGWRELTALGHGVRLIDSHLPTASVSNQLRAYPQDLLSSPLDLRSASFRTEPGEGGGVAALPAVGKASFTTRWTTSAENTLRGMVGGRLTPAVGLLAVLLALALGAAHAALPGHGKTVMAAYLAGRRGRPRDAITVGATVTLTHTGGVIVLGVLLTTVAGLAGEQVLGWLGVVSGGLVAIVGVSMLAAALRRRGKGDGHSWLGGGHHHHHGPDGHTHDHDHPHAHEHDHPHPHEHDHPHDHEHDDPHTHGGRRPGYGRLGLIGMGVAGGLVPSPSALIVLLGAIGLGRTAFGILLVLTYGLGMAGTLTAAGLMLIRIQERLARRAGPRSARWAGLATRAARLAPTSTAALVLVVGLGLAGRAVAGLA
jgi:nickel/cobalt transporter (NicO) family protein